MKKSFFLSISIFMVLHALIFIGCQTPGAHSEPSGLPQEKTWVDTENNVTYRAYRQGESDYFLVKEQQDVDGRKKTLKQTPINSFGYSMVLNYMENLNHAEKVSNKVIMETGPGYSRTATYGDQTTTIEVYRDMLEKELSGEGVGKK